MSRGNLFPLMLPVCLFQQFSLTNCVAVVYSDHTPEWPENRRSCLPMRYQPKLLDQEDPFVNAFKDLEENKHQEKETNCCLVYFSQAIQTFWDPQVLGSMSWAMKHQRVSFLTSRGPRTLRD